jgi:hypothetical protein
MDAPILDLIAEMASTERVGYRDSDDSAHIEAVGDWLDRMREAAGALPAGHAAAAWADGVLGAYAAPVAPDSETVDDHNDLVAAAAEFVRLNPDLYPELFPPEPGAAAGP